MSCATRPSRSPLLAGGPACGAEVASCCTSQTGFGPAGAVFGAYTGGGVVGTSFPAWVLKAPFRPWDTGSGVLHNRCSGPASSRWETARPLQREMVTIPGMPVGDSIGRAADPLLLA